MSGEQNIADLLKLDSQDMFSVLKDFPKQVSEACRIGENAPLFNEPPVSPRYVVLGMGGSAIGGDLLSSYLCGINAGNISISVNRGYKLPAYVGADTNVIASSYSGNTEETITAFKEALAVTKRIICITTGGKLEEIARANSIPVIKIPAGLQPRCAVGYSFFPVLYVLLRSEAVSPEATALTMKKIDSLQVHLNNLSAIYSDVNSDKNLALEIARQVVGTVPVIYSSHERLDSVNLRWRCQINENSKNLSFGNLLPEMNHNEINAWSYPNDILKKFSLILLRDPDDNERVRIRFDAVKQVLGPNVSFIKELQGKGDSLLVRMFDLIYLGDWLSYYLALLNNADPTPIPLIIKLKDILSSH